MDKNQKIQEHFPLFRFQFDTNRINARGKSPDMNQLEEWAKNGIITLNFSDTVLGELQGQADHKKHLEKTKGYPEGHKKTLGKLFTVSFPDEDEQQASFEKIKNILFPDGCKTDNQLNDVRIVFDAYKYHYILITNDGASNSQIGILGNASALKSEIGVIVMRDNEAVALVNAKLNHNKLPT